MNWMAVLIVPVTVMYVVVSSSRHGLFTPGAIFAVTNLLAAISILPLLDTSNSADVVHGRILLYVGLVFPSFSLLFESWQLGRSRDMRRPSLAIFVPRGGTHLLMLLSALITVGYFVAVGYSALFIGIKNAAAGGSADIAGLRLDSYAGSRYLFPGYVNQFKNVLLPSLIVLTLTYWHRRGRVPVSMTVGLVALALFGLLGTGQRGAFVLFVVAVIVYLYLINRNFSIRRVAAIGVVALAFLMASTFALGRGSHGVQGTGFLGGIGVLLDGIANRIFSQGGAGKVAGFRYIYAQASNAHGHEWVQSMLGILPGSRGSTLANEIFAYQWGGTRGNSPPSIWADIFYNFGAIGVVLAPLALAAGFAWLTSLRAERMPHANTLEAMGIAGVCVVVGFWTAGSPAVPFNNGLVMFALIWWAGARVSASARRRAPRPGRRRAPTTRRLVQGDRRREGEVPPTTAGHRGVPSSARP